MSSNQIARPIETTTVRAEAVLEHGQKVFQIYPINHPQGTDNGQILGAAVNISRQMGGLLEDTPSGGLNFYPLHLLFGPINFEIKNIALVGADAMPIGRPHIVQ